MAWYGYRGKILRINLTKRNITIEELRKNDTDGFIGGSGLGSKFLYGELEKGTDPLGPGNVLIFSTGPMTGTKLFNSNRFSAIAKSPLTGIFAEASAGGYWGGTFKRCGYDVLIVQGMSETPVCIIVDDTGARIEDASFLWGKDTIEATDLIRQRFGQNAKAAVIGKAGENKVRLANIVTDGAHARVLGRCGLGAVMGSKNLKAVVVNGTGDVPVADDGKLTALMKKIGNQMKEGPDPLRKHGTPVQLDIYNEIGELPLKNWQMGIWTEGAGNITGRRFTEKVLLRRYHCGSCMINCGRVVHATDGKYKGREIAGPEYETIGMLGANCLVDDVHVIVRANELLNRYGLDSVSTGSAIAFAMEAYDRGIITTHDTDGIELRWGDGEAVLEMIGKIGNREGIGELLGQGVRRASEQLGGTAKEFAVEVKGLEAPGHDPRAKFTLALGYATSARGACHVSSFTMDFEEGLTIEDLDLPPMPDRFTTENKAEGVMMMQNWMGLFDSLVLCKFALFGGMTPSIISEALTYVTGNEYDKACLLRAGSRIYNMKRLFNVREGVSRKDDTLPPRFLFQKKGGETDRVPPLNILLDDFYRLRGWDDSGVPTADTLKALSLDEYLPRLIHE